ncbi:MAG: hypothetical protein V4738_03220 [Pseudomonadota bacterium]
MPKGSDFWRIDWFGDILFPDRLTRRKQPSVFVHLSRVFDANFLQEPQKLLLPTATDTFNTSSRWVSVGQMSILRAGDIWQNQERVLQPDYQVETFADLTIDRATTTLLKAGIEIGDHHILPFAEHPWHTKGTLSYCVSVSLNDGRKLVVPCMELIRFYFGSSGSLLSKLFAPPLKRTSLYSKALIANWDKALDIELGDGISGASAADIARIACVKEAWNAAAMVGHSILKCAASGTPMYPQTVFPFEGKTTLSASGKWLSFGGKPNQTFIVFSLRSCSAEFPFKSLRYELKGGPRKRLKSPGQDPSVASSQTRKVVKGAKTGSDLVEQDASSHLAPKLRSYPSDKFPDLREKFIKQAESKSAEADATTLGGSAATIQSVSVGEGASNKRVRPIDLVEALRTASERNQPIPEFLREPLDYLSKQSEVGHALLTDAGPDGWTVPMPWLADADGEINPDSHQQLPDGSYNPRRLCVLRIEHGSRSFHLALIEDSPVFVHLDHGLTYLPGESPEALIQRIVGAFYKRSNSSVMCIEQCVAKIRATSAKKQPTVQNP